jgi:hypothetical protein
MAKSSSTVAELSPYQLKLEGSSPDITNGARRYLIVTKSKVFKAIATTCFKYSIKNLNFGTTSGLYYKNFTIVR